MQHLGNGWSSLFYSQSEAGGVCRKNSQVLSGADEWGVVMLVIFVIGQYHPKSTFKKRVEMRQTWAGNSASWAVPVPTGVSGKSRSGTGKPGIASSLVSLLKDISILSCLNLGPVNYSFPQYLNNDLPFFWLFNLWCQAPMKFPQ